MAGWAHRFAVILAAHGVLALPHSYGTGDVWGAGEIGDVPVAVTFCPLCNSAIVFDRRVDGETYRFGVSGNLRNSDLVMWDDVTKSWWQQFTGEGIVGQHAGDQLDIFPSLIVGFGEFQEQYPDGEVLSPQGRFYGVNPYEGYDLSARPFLFDGQLDAALGQRFLPLPKSGSSGRPILLLE